MGLLEKIINIQIEQYRITEDVSKSLLKKATNILSNKNLDLKKNSK